MKSSAQGDHSSLCECGVDAPIFYVWGLIKWDPSKPRRLLFWAPDHDTLALLVQQGRLKGDNSRIGSLEVAVDNRELEDMIPAPIWTLKATHPGENYIPDAFGWTEPWFCERMEP
jgi:hypothetical protein